MTTAAEVQAMQLELSPEQQQERLRFRAFVREHIAPHAGAWDRQALMPMTIVEQLRRRGYLGAPLPQEVGGGGMDAITYGLLTEEIGAGCSSVRSLLTVHDMVTIATRRWGTPFLKQELVPRMARAELLAAFALSEPNIGSDAAGVETVARQDGDHWVLDGAKKWTTFGQIADVYLVFARTGEKVSAFLVPADTPGCTRRPLTGMVGTRASMLAEIELKGCRISADYQVGKVGAGFPYVITTALDHGRYSVAWGSVGISQACLDACLDYTAQRRQFGRELREHQLVQRMLTEMIVNTRAARLLCYRAGYLRRSGDPGTVPETMIAKYFASRQAVRAANDAVQLHGANGLSESYPLERYLRDAKVTEIIEGSTQIQQFSIPGFPLAEL